jgi:hypothetical protein
VLFALSFTGNDPQIMSMLGAIMLIGIVVKKRYCAHRHYTLYRERGYGAIRAPSRQPRTVCARFS